jgi:membrane protein
MLIVAVDAGAGYEVPYSGRVIYLMGDGGRLGMGGAVRAVYARIQEHQVATLSAALAFYAILSAVPLLSVAVAALGLAVGNSTTARHRIESALAHFLPGAGASFPRVVEAMRVGSGAYGLFGILTLLVTGAAVFATLEVAFNRIWGAAKPRGWLGSRVNAVAAAILVLVLLLLSILSTSLLAYAKATEVPGLRQPVGDIVWIWRWLQVLGPLALSVSTFTVLYKMVPNCPVAFRAALKGGLVAGIGWEAAKIAFTFYLAHSVSYNRVYGPLAGLVIGMVWVYYSSMVALIGAEVAALRDEE